jgi:hypothetical protein
LDSDDLKNIEEAFKFPDEKKLREEALIRWRDRELWDTMKDIDLTLRINKLNEEIVLIEDKTEFELLYERLESENSEGWIQATILKLKIWRIMIVELSDKVIKSNGFDNAVIAIIVSNSIYLAIDDYYMQNNPSQEV